MPTRPRSEIVEELHELGIIIDRREIFLGGDNDSDDINSQSAIRFIKNMRILQRYGDPEKPIIVHQFNSGGDWFAGMAIYDAIANSESHVTIVCHGPAMSMGSIIPQSADLRIMMPNAVFMIHGGSSDINPDMTYKQGQTWSYFDKQSYQKMLGIYTEVCQHGLRFKGKTLNIIKSDLKRKMDTKEDWIISAREAVEYGFADAVLGDKGYESLNLILNKK